MSASRADPLRASLAASKDGRKRSIHITAIHADGAAVIVGTSNGVLLRYTVADALDSVQVRVVSRQAFSILAVLITNGLLSVPILLHRSRAKEGTERTVELTISAI
eukprot:6187905-Pleurochrysis_carterae.AAC.2